jgi:Mg2+/citrate symporter
MVLLDGTEAERRNSLEGARNVMNADPDAGVGVFYWCASPCEVHVSTSGPAASCGIRARILGEGGALMSYKPSELYLGIADIFVVMLPGMVLTALMAIVWYAGAVWPPERSLGSTDWAAFLLSSYLAGHLVSALGAFLEDWWNETVRGKGRIDKERAKHGALRSAAELVVGRLLPEFQCEKDQVRRMAATIVQLQGGAGATQLQRKDADRRLFRNLSVVLALLGAFEVGVLRWTGLGTRTSVVFAVGCAIAALLCYHRYRDQDAKYSRDAYECLIVQESLNRRSSHMAEKQGTAARGDYVEE